MFQKVLILIALQISLFSSQADEMRKSMALEYLENRAIMEEHQKEAQEIVRQNYIYYKNIVQKAREYYRGYVAKEWGEENIKLSNKKTFTQYSDDMKSREHIDFEKGRVIIEQIVDLNETVELKVFEDKLAKLQDESSAEAIKKDPVSNLTIAYMKKKDIAQKTKTKPNNEKFLKGQIENTEIKLQEKIVTLPTGVKKKILFAEIKMVPNHLEKRAKRYKSKVLEEAQALHVKPSYVFGTIQTESYFNPLAISHVPAYGLMQIVPASAGIDAYFALYGKKRLLPPAYLYDSKNNIEIGTKYIQIIRDRYLKGVEDKDSLTYCTATSYNAGIGSLFRSFTGSKRKRKEAIAKINSMSSDEVYEHLRSSEKLTKEARDYVAKIKKHSSNYAKWDVE